MSPWSAILSSARNVPENSASAVSSGESEFRAGSAITPLTCISEARLYNAWVSTRLARTALRSCELPNGLSERMCRVNSVMEPFGSSIPPSRGNDQIGRVVRGGFARLGDAGARGSFPLGRPLCDPLIALQPRRSKQRRVALTTRSHQPKGVDFWWRWRSLRTDSAFAAQWGPPSSAGWQGQRRGEWP